MTADRTRLFGVVVRPFQAFLRLEAASGILLLLSAVAALLWANLAPDSYRATFEHPLSVGAGGFATVFTVTTLINDGLMTLFFFVVGMEIKRELVVGELNSPAKAVLPAIAAVGGMVLPAGIFLAFNAGEAGQSGWGIPMATDIAFCVGVLTLLKTRVPRGLVVFVIALAIFDDIGGILVIAFFYGHGLNLTWLMGAAVLTVVLLAMNRAYVRHGLAYAVAGLGLWYALQQGGIHATISGVVLGLMVPAMPNRSPREVLRELAEHVSELDRKPRDEDLDGAEILAIEEKLEDLQPPIQRFIHALHPVVAFWIMPVFALANSGVPVSKFGAAMFASPIVLGTAVGLLVRKPIGIFGLTMLAVRFGVAPMPGHSSWTKLFGASVIAGIGFTVALFIAGLAFHGAGQLLNEAKMGVLLGSLVAGAAGFAVLRFSGGHEARQLPAGLAKDRGTSAPEE